MKTCPTSQLTYQSYCICPKQYARLELVGPKLQNTESPGNKKVTSDLCLCSTLYTGDLACNHMKIDEKMINYNNISPKKMSCLKSFDYRKGEM